MLHLVALMIVSIILTAASPAKSQIRIWWEEGIAGTTTGYNRLRQSFVEHKIYLATFGPNEYLKNSRVATCASAVGRKVGTSLRESIQRIVISDQNSSSAMGSSTTTARKESVRLIQSSMMIHQYLHERELAACMRQDGEAHRQFGFGIILRYCGYDRNSCHVTSESFHGDPSATAFDWIFNWFRDVNVLNDFIKLNALYRIEHSSPSSLKVSPIHEKISSVIDWALNPGEEVLQVAYEDASIRARMSKKKFSWSAPIASGISQEIALQLIDVVIDPGTVRSFLPSRPQSALRIASNEVARQRIYECHRLRGLTSLSDISRCSGYNVTEEIITSCLAYIGRCNPGFGGIL